MAVNINPFAIKAQYGPDGRPLMPDWDSIAGPNGMLQSQYQTTARAAPTSLAEIEKRAMVTGPSDWLKLQLKNQEQQQMDAQNQLVQQGSSANADAASQLAMRGGLSGGSRERLARSSMRDILMGKQDLARSGSANRLGLEMADEQNRTNLLMNLPQAQAAERQYQTGIEQYNIEKALAERAAKRAAELGKYSEEMKGYAAEKSAQGIANSGGGGKK